MINLYGVFDNWAWAFVCRHNLAAEIGNRRQIGLFNDATRRYLVTPLRAYLSSETTTKWHDEYLKNYRDALAHRIPLYIPPAVFTDAEGARYNELEAEKVACIRAMNHQRLEEIAAEQAGLGQPCFFFLHAFSEDTPARPLSLHPQVLSDSKTVVEFGTKYLEHWHERA